MSSQTQNRAKMGKKRNKGKEIENNCRTHTKVGSTVCVSKWEDVKKVEEVEDCFILEFDPTKLKNNGELDKDDDNDDGEIIGSIVCVKRKEDVKRVEETEDCFILEFDPNEDATTTTAINYQLSKLSIRVKTETVTEEFDDCEEQELSILAEKGQVACRDYPHPRHLCALHPFNKTSHDIHCNMCYCYICDRPAPCDKWTEGKDPSLKHCDATPLCPQWKIANRIW